MIKRLLFTFFFICLSPFLSLFPWFINDSNQIDNFKTSVQGYNTVDLNVRSKPDVKSQIKSVLTKNSEILISNIISNNWGLIGTRDSIALGYVSLTYIKDIKSNPILFDEIRPVPSDSTINDIISVFYSLFVLISPYVYLIWLFRNWVYIRNKKFISFSGEGINYTGLNIISKIRNSIRLDNNSFYFTYKINYLNRFGLYISSWKKFPGDQIKIGDKVCTLIVNKSYYIDVESKIEGIFDSEKSEQVVDGDYELMSLNPNDLLFTVHSHGSIEATKDLRKKRVIFNESVSDDEFSESVEIKWDKVFGTPILSNKYFNNTQNPNNKIYTYGDGFLLKKGVWDLELQLRFTFNFTNQNNFIVFKYSIINPYKFKHGTYISFKYDNDDVLSFEILKPFKNESEEVYQSKSVLTKTSLNTFISSKLIRWKITPSTNSESIEGEISDIESQNILQDYSSKYLNLVKKHVKNYDEIKSDNSKFSSEQDEDCFVYLMVDTTNSYHKIGISNSPKYREKTLQSEKPTIELVCSKSFISRKMCLTIEQSLHKTFESKRIRGEWFNLSNKDIEKVKQVLS